MNVNPAVAAYSRTVDTLVPGLPHDLRRLRCGILYLRDRAAAAHRDATWAASMAAGAVESVAAAYALAPIPREQLKALHHALLRMMMAAQQLNALGPGSISDDV